MSKARHLSIFGVRISNETYAEGMRWMREALGGDTLRVLFYAHFDGMNRAAHDPRVAELFAAADRVYGDGTGIRWAARVRGVRMLGNLNGTDMVPELLQEPGSDQVKAFLLGGDERTAEAAAAQVARCFPRTAVVGSHHGYVRPDGDEELVEMISASGADLLLVGMGTPLQETWLIRNRDRLRCRLAVGVGGLFDHWAGNIRRAPRWMRAIGMEWAALPLQQPHKLRRYLFGGMAFGWRMCLHARRDRRD